MTWIALVGPELEENLSLRYLASSLATAGYRAELVVYNGDADFANAIETIARAVEPPAVVGISLAFQWRAQDFLALAMALRENGYRGHITLGGHFATFASDDILREFPEVDSIVRQEGEETIVALVNAVIAGAPLDIPGLALRNAHGEPHRTPEAALPDLARLPFPDRRGEPAACFGHPIAPLVGSRGCYANCSFCCIAAWHEQSLPGKRYRLRSVECIADEMVAMQRERGIDVFVFHDDNFFLPGHKKNIERFTALADALEARGIGRYATVVKARPTDVDREVFRVLQQRLHCIRCYIGVETDADQGLETLRRWSHASQNKKAIEIVRELDLYVCFNLLIFDPDTTLESLRTNVRFLRYASEFPSNFGRVELYAGTPLLQRMLAEGRCRGDWMQYDYALASRDVERVFGLAMQLFHVRNFGGSADVSGTPDALSNRIMGTRFDLEVCRHFHREIFRAEWLAEGKALNRMLTEDGARVLDAVIDHVERGDTNDDALIASMLPRMREVERLVSDGACALANKLYRAIGRGRPLTDLGDRVATPLQTSRNVEGILTSLGAS
jgi:anaerobic magnesium-protoporphyrin IX monomethyl ester cyclase